MKIETIVFPTSDGRYIERLQILAEDDEEAALVRRMWRALTDRRLPFPDPHYGDIRIDGVEISGFRLDNELPFNPAGVQEMESTLPME